MNRVMKICKPAAALFTVFVLVFGCLAFTPKTAIVHANILDNVWDGIVDVGEGIGDAVGDIMDGNIGGVVDDVIDTGTEVADDILGTDINGAYNGVKNAITGDEEKDSTYSLYDISCILGEYLNNATKPNDDNANGMPSGIKALDSSLDSIGTLEPGDAGAFVAYAEKGWLASLFSNSSTTYAYSSFHDIVTSEGTGNKTDALLDYAQYGYVLGQLGLDTSATETTFAFGNWLTGFPMLGMYILTLGVPAVFSIILSVLRVLNPFALLAPAVNNTSLKGSSNPMPESEPGSLFDANLFDGLKGVISEWYSVFYEFSWQIVIPICFVALIVSALLFRRAWQQNGTSKIKKYAIRIIFLCIGIPICGGCYTAALDKMAEITDSDNGAATRVIASTFVDFEAWAENGRLTPPDGLIEIERKSVDTVDSPTNHAILNTRAASYYINQAWAYSNLKGTAPFGGSATASSSAKWNKDIMSGEYSKNNINDGSTEQENSFIRWLKSVINGNNEKSNTATTLNILLRYIGNDFYYGSDYETVIKASLTNKAAETGSGYSGFIRDLFKFSSKLDYFYAKNSDKDDEQWKREIGQHRFRDMTDFFKGIDVKEDKLENRDWGAGNMPNVFANGGLSLSEVNGTTSVYSSIGNLTNSSDIFAGLTQQGGLSTVAMFNYLNTSFDSTSLTVFSSEKASSGFVRKGHKSVSLVGTGFLSALYYINCLILLGAFAIIGYFYAFSIIFGNIKRGIKLIVSVPVALLGGIRAIAKIITYTVIMIIEIVATVFAYTLITELLMDISGLIEAPFVSILSVNSVFFGQVSGMVLTCLALLISCIVYVIFIIMSLRFRKKIVKSLDEMAAMWIDKFLDTKAGVVGNVKQPGIVSKVGGAVAAGAGMAAGNKLMNGISDGLTKNPTAAGNTSTKSGASGGASLGSGKGNGMGSGDSNQNVSGGIALTGDISEVGNRLPGGDNPELMDNNSSDINPDGNGPENAESLTNPALDTGAGFGTAEQTSDDKDRALAGQLSDSSTLAAVPGVSNADDVKGAVSDKQDKFDNKMDAVADNATGKTSAIEEEANDDKKKEIAKEERKEAAKDMATGGAKAVKGAAEAYVGANTGDAKMTAEGIKDLKQGTDQMAGAGKKAATAGERAEAQVNAEQAEKNRQKDIASVNNSGASGQNSDNNNKSVSADNTGNKPSSTSAETVSKSTDTKTSQTKSVSAGSGSAGQQKSAGGGVKSVGAGQTVNQQKSESGGQTQGAKSSGVKSVQSPSGTSPSGAKTSSGSASGSTGSGAVRSPQQSRGNTGTGTGTGAVSRSRSGSGSGNVTVRGQGSGNVSQIGGSTVNNSARSNTLLNSGSKSQQAVNVSGTQNTNNIPTRPQRANDNSVKNHNVFNDLYIGDEIASDSRSFDSGVGLKQPQAETAKPVKSDIGAGRTSGNSYDGNQGMSDNPADNAIRKVLKGKSLSDK